MSINEPEVAPRAQSSTTVTPPNPTPPTNLSFVGCTPPTSSAQTYADDGVPAGSSINEPSGSVTAFAAKTAAASGGTSVDHEGRGTETAVTVSHAASVYTPIPLVTLSSDGPYTTSPNASHPSYVTGGGGPVVPPFTATTYIEDHFNNTGGSNVALVGWIPDTIGTVAWQKNVASTDNAQVANTTKNVIGTTATGTYYVNETAVPVSDYSITGKIGDTFGASLLTRFSDTVLTGYRIARDTTNTQTTFGTFVQRGVTGSFTQLGALGVVPSGNIIVQSWVMSDRVRIKLQDVAAGCTIILDDTNAARVTTQGFPGLSVRTAGGSIDDIVVQNVPAVARGGTQLTADGVWTWFNDPRAITSGGRTYFSYVAADGSVKLAKLDGGVVTEVTVSNGLEKDDHDNGGLIVLPGGRIAVFYSKHASDTVGMRYRVSTNPLPDISAFNTEVLIANGGVQTAYAKPYYFTDDGKIRLYYRNGNSTQRDQKVASALATQVEAGTASWTLATVIAMTNQRPYIQMTQNGANRVDFFMTNGHPNEVVTSLYHMYMTVSGGVESYFKSDGTALGAAPIDPTTAILIDDGTTGGRSWNWDISVGADGRPRVLFAKYPSSTGARDVVFTDVQYWHGRWSGSSWVKTQLSSGQHSLYAAENHYLAGLAFDRNDATNLLLCEWNATNGVNRAVEYSFNETSNTKTQSRVIADDPSSHQFRPYSPVGHGTDCRWVWAEGGYVTYGAVAPQASTAASPAAWQSTYNATLRYIA